MKRVIFSLAAVVALMVSTATPSNATKWADTGWVETFGTCEIVHQSCVRRFLSFDGCSRGDTRAIFDDANSDCQSLILNGGLFVQ